MGYAMKNASARHPEGKWDSIWAPKKVKPKMGSYFRIINKATKVSFTDSFIEISMCFLLIK